MNSSKFIKINEQKVHYLEKGKGNTILFLHGIPTSSYLWRNIIPALSGKNRCIAPDLIGMGKSSKPKMYSITEELRDIKDFIKNLELTNITLVLHGFGSIIGLSYAMNNLDNIKGIAFYEPYLRPNKNINRLSFLAQKLAHHCNYKKIVEDNFLIDNLLPNMAFKKLDHEVKSHYQKPFIDLENRKTLWCLFEELFLNDYSNHKLDDHILKYSEFLQKSSIPKLLLYSNPGFNTSMATIKWCQNNLTNISLADLGEDLDLAQESNPSLFSTVLLDWYTKNIDLSSA